VFLAHRNQRQALSNRVNPQFLALGHKPDFLDQISRNFCGLDSRVLLVQG
jgi:hypothetical protein